MNWQPWLEPDERLVWEGRPAPRCFTFRNWKHALVGIILLLLGGWWEIVAVQLEAVYDLPFLPLIPLPVCLFALYLSVGQLLWSRLQWEHLFYAVTDRRILLRQGRRPKLRALPLARVSFFRLRQHGEALGSLRVYAGSNAEVLHLSCLEQPRRLTDLLEAAMRSSGMLAPESD